jgi:hypothetical protein
MLKCPECGTEEISVYFSVCKDPECCGCPDNISCDKCSYDHENYSYDTDTFEEKLLELGMTKEEIENVKK